VRAFIDAQEGVITSTGSMRAPVFYDSNDTNYYVNPGSSSVAAKLRGSIFIEKGNNTSNAIDINQSRSSTWPFKFTTYEVGNDNSSGFWNSNRGYPDMRLRRDGSTVKALISSWERSYTSNGFTDATDMRAPIFYDSNDTNYKLDPSGTSNLSKVYFNKSSTPIVVNLSSSHKSWVHHISSGGDDYIFAPSTADNNESWDWANAVYMSSKAIITANNFKLRSDERLKTKITNLSSEHIDADWKTFEMKSDKGQKRYGVIAQELEVKNPEFVRTDEEGMKSVAYIDLLIAKIAELEARLEKAGI